MSALIKNKIHQIAILREDGKTWAEVQEWSGCDMSISHFEKACRKEGLVHGYDLRSSNVKALHNKLAGLTDDMIIDTYNSDGKEAALKLFVSRGVDRHNGFGALKRLARAGKIDFKQKKRLFQTAHPEGCLIGYTDPPSLILGPIRKKIIGMKWA